VGQLFSTEDCTEGQIRFPVNSKRTVSLSITHKWGIEGGSSPGCCLFGTAA
jgi:hypothetical protein